MAASTSNTFSPYELLGIPGDARDDVINKAFRQKSLKVHPDRNPDNPEAGEFYYSYRGTISFLTSTGLKACARI